MPAYEYRLITAKLFIELSEFELAAEILEGLTEDDDQVSEVWYLLAFSYSHYEILSSRDCLEKAKKLLKIEGIEDASIWEQINELESKISEAEAQVEGQNQLNQQEGGQEGGMDIE